MTEITQQQMDNLIMLRGVIENKLGQDESVLDGVFQPCGTYGCVLGDYLLKKAGVKHEDDIPDEVRWAGDVFGDDPKNIKEFGLPLSAPVGIRLDVFGPSGWGAIQQRLDFVNDLIAKSVVKGKQPDLSVQDVMKRLGVKELKEAVTI